ncbi:unnamed protein product, partial [Meganyctiphanes norvegica]
MGIEGILDLPLQVKLLIRCDNPFRCKIHRHHEDFDIIHHFPNDTIIVKSQYMVLKVDILEVGSGQHRPNVHLRLSRGEFCPGQHSSFIILGSLTSWTKLMMTSVIGSTVGSGRRICLGIFSYSISYTTSVLDRRSRHPSYSEILLYIYIYIYTLLPQKSGNDSCPDLPFNVRIYHFRISEVVGLFFAVYHSFHDEVDQYRQHIWQCDGPCRKRPPYFGMVKRSMNRIPGPRDTWWGRHQQNCGGSYTKIKEPEGYGTKKRKTDEGKKSKTGKDIRGFFDSSSTSLTNSSGGPSEAKKSNPKDSVGSGNLFRGKEDKLSGFSNKESQSSIQVPKNVHGFGSTGTGDVVKKGVDNASRSNVHGFGKATRGGRGRGLKGVTTATGGSTVGGTAGRGRGGGNFTAMRGGGSKTVTVKGKTRTNEESDELDPSRISSLPEDFVPFNGTGFSLGGQRSTNSLSGASRLISIGINNSSHNPSRPQSILNNSQGTSSHLPTSNIKPENSASQPFNYSTNSSSNSPFANDKSVTCPVCNKLMPVGQVNLHLDECIGDFDEDMDQDIEESNLIETSNNSEITKKNKEEIDLTVFPTNNSITKKVEDIDLAHSSSFHLPVKVEKSNKKNSCLDEVNISIISVSSEDGGPEQVLTETVDNIQSEEKFPCPVCSKPFTQKEINQHLDNHF